MALRCAPPVFGRAEAGNVAREVYGLSASVHPLSGERDCNFRLTASDGREYVLKIIDGSADAATTDCQVRVLRHLAEQGAMCPVPVPRMHKTLRGTDLGTVEQSGVTYGALLLDYLPGRLLGDRTPDCVLITNLGIAAARLDRALQGFFHPALNQHIAWDVRRLPELMQFAAYVKRPMRSIVDTVTSSVGERLPAIAGLRSQAIHGDLHAGNLLVDASGREVCGVLDFGDMLHAPLILEAAVAMSELLTDGLAQPNSLLDFLDGFNRHAALEAADVTVLYDLIMARHATTILVHAWRTRHDPAGARVLERGAANAASSLEQLMGTGRDATTRQFHEVAGTAGPDDAVVIDLGRRHRLMGAGAELFYETPLHFVSASGVWLYDPQGQAYLDVYNNVPHVGHNHPTVIRAIDRQNRALVTHTRYWHGRILEYAERLLEKCPPHLDTCIFVNSGSEANDVAWRMAQFATGHGGGVVLANAYHGITSAVAALTPGVGAFTEAHVVILTPPSSHLTAFGVLSPEQSAAATQDALRAVQLLEARAFGTAAFFIDTALTSSGIFDPPQAWGVAVEAVIRSAGGLIVADEVQYGFGRSGSHFWGFERRGLTPDIVTLGKPVGNGYPMGVVIANRSLIEAFQAKYGFFSTFGGNPVAASAGLAVLAVLEREQLMTNARTTGEYLRQRLEEVAAQYECLGTVRGAGLLLGVEVLGPDAAVATKRTKEIINRLAAHDHVLIGYEGPLVNLLKVRPPMPFRPEHADLLVKAINTAAAAIETRAS